MSGGSLARIFRGPRVLDRLDVVVVGEHPERVMSVAFERRRGLLSECAEIGVASIGIGGSNSRHGPGHAHPRPATPGPGPRASRSDRAGTGVDERLQRTRPWSMGVAAPLLGESSASARSGSCGSPTHLRLAPHWSTALVGVARTGAVPRRPSVPAASGCAIGLGRMQTDSSEIRPKIGTLCGKALRY